MRLASFHMPRPNIHSKPITAAIAMMMTRPSSQPNGSCGVPSYETMISRKLIVPVSVNKVVAATSDDVV
jgi:hypothetical protein